MTSARVIASVISSILTRHISIGASALLPEPFCAGTREFIPTALAHTRARVFPRGEETNETEKREREKKIRGISGVSGNNPRNSHVGRAEERTHTESRCALERGSRATELSAALASYGRAFRRLRVGGRKKGQAEPGGPPSSARSRARGTSEQAREGERSCEEERGIARARVEKNAWRVVTRCNHYCDIFGIALARVPFSVILTDPRVRVDSLVGEGFLRWKRGFSLRSVQDSLLRTVGK